MRARAKAGRQRAGFTLIELMVVVVILGVLTTIAIPTVTLYIQRTKTGEARLNLAKMFDSTVAYFHTEHVDRGSTQTLASGGIIAQATHLCPHPSGMAAGGEAGVTPDPMVTDCNAGPGGRCVPSTAPGPMGYYDLSEWGNNPVWNGLNFMQEQAHYFHYNFQSSNQTTGFGACRFTSQAFGDLDDDMLYSTFERSGAADANGVDAAAGLYISHVVE